MAKQNKPVVTKKRQAWASARKAVVKGHPLNYNAAVEERYRNRLNALINQMTAQTRRELEKLYKADHAKAFFGMDATVSAQAKIITNSLAARFQQLFDRKADGLARAMVSDNDKVSSSTLHSSLKEMSGGLSLKTTSITPAMKQILAASITENVGLIKSIPSQYFDQVQGAVMRSITTGNGLQDLVPALEKYDGITTRRARLIARDQTRKVYNNLNASRMKSNGVKKFEWLHSAGDREPRPLHLQLSGQIFSFNNLPVIDDKTGQRGKPGDLINCSCKMIPIVDFSEGGMLDDDGSNDSPAENPD